MQTEHVDDGRDWLHDISSQGSDTQYQVGRRHSSVVRIIRIVLIAAALILCGILTYNLTQGHNEYAVDLSSKQKTKTTDISSSEGTTALLGTKTTEEELTQGEVAMLRAKYGGLDEKKQPYTITADKASRSSDTPDVINLRQPMADILLNDGSWIATRGLQGTYMQDHMQLFLNEKVKLFHDEGYEMETENLHIDLKTSVMRSQTSVFAHGPVGEIRSEGIEFIPTEDKIVFAGPATLKLLSQTEKIAPENKTNPETLKEQKE